jgi:hypothetical protein
MAGIAILSLRAQTRLNTLGLRGYAGGVRSWKEDAAPLLLGSTVHAM